MTRTAGLETAAALLMGLILVVLGSVLADPGSTQPDLRTSTYVNDPNGARALFELLKAAGLQPQRLLETVGALPDTDRTLVVAAPSEPCTDEQRDALFDWVADGGRLVVVAALSAPPLRSSFHDRLLERTGLRSRRRWVASRALEVVPGEGIETDVAIECPPTQVLEPLPPEAERDERAGTPRPLIRSRSHVIASIVPFGENGGEVVALADESILTNEHLRRADNAVVMVQLLTARGRDDGRIVFDEYHHGFRELGARASLYAQAVPMLWTTWPGRGVLLLLVAWIVLLAGRSVRLGAPLPAAAPPRRRLSEHAEALGMLLEKARSRTEALRVLAAGVRRAVGPRAGLAPTLAPGAFRDRLAASPAPGAADLAAALEIADRLEPSRDAEVASTARVLAETRIAYLHGDIHRVS